jgi:YVTN family beta-propeller protein
MIFLLILVLSLIISQLMPDILAEENTVIATISVGDAPRGIAFDSANNRMYVTNWDDDTVSVINTATNGVIETISVGDAPYGMAFDFANNRLYIANAFDNTISVINTATNAVDATIAAGTNPVGIAFDSANDRLYVTNYNQGIITVIDTDDNTIITTISVGGAGSFPQHIAFDSANNRMYVTEWKGHEVSVINTATNAVDATIAAGTNPVGIAFDSANDRMYVSISSDDVVKVINTATNVVDATISVGNSPREMAFDSANNRMYVSNLSDDTVSVINTATNVVDTTISVGDKPRGIAFDSANNRMYVVNNGDDTVSVIDIAPVAEETKETKKSGSCYDCEAPKLTKVEVHITSQNPETQRISKSSEIWNFEQDSPLPMFGDTITPIVADPGDEVEIILELTDNRTLERVYDSGTYTNFLTKPNDMNTFYANNFDEYGKVSTTYYEWHQTGEDLVYDYSNTVQWSEPDITIQESGEFVKDGISENLDGLVGTFTISFKMKFLEPMKTSDVWVQATDRSGNFFKVALPLTLKITGNELLLFDSKVNQKVLSFFDESMLLEVVSDWTGSSQDVSELTAVLGIPDEQLPSWVTNLAMWVSEDEITLVDMIVSIEHLINN